MQNFSQQAQVALGIYLKRIHELLQKLEQQKYDEALELWVLQKSAFHNFCTAEFLARKYTQPLPEEELKMLWLDIQIILPQLHHHLSDALFILEKKAVRLARQKNHLQSFKSTKGEDARFEKII